MMTRSFLSTFISLTTCVVTLCLLFALQACIGDDDDDVVEADVVKVGDTLPGFTVITHQGDVVSADSLQGKVSVIVFFNTSCPDCQQELPLLDSLYEQYPQVQFLAISREEDEGSIQSFWATHQLSLPYSAQATRDVYHLFARRNIPRIYMSDVRQVVRYIFTDTPLATYEQLCAALKTIVLYP